MALITPSAKWHALAAVFVVLLSLALPATGQSSYVFTKVLDFNTPRPDGAGVFVLTNQSTPAFDGQWVVFRDNGNKDDGSYQAIWSFNTLDKSFRKLVDLKSRIPGGTSTFTDLQLQDTAPSVRQGVVVFLGRDSSTGNQWQGVYSVPAAGGAITKIADHNTTNPSGGTFGVLDMNGRQVGGFHFDGSTAAFFAQGSAQTQGVYSAKPDGTSVGLIADTLHPFTAAGGKVTGFTVPVVSGGNVVMLGTDGADTSTGYHGLYLGKVGGTGAVTELLNSNQPLPGSASAGFHTRFDAPVLSMDGSLVAFRADDATLATSSSPLFGLYWTDLTSHAVNKIADVNSTLPGLGKLRSIADTGVSVSQGNVLFQAADVTTGYPGKSGMYLWANGSTSRIVGTGDVLDGKTVQVVSDPGPAALAGSGFAMIVEFGQTNGLAIYAATPAPSATSVAAVTNAASYGAASVAPGEVVTLFGAGMGPSVLAYYTLTADSKLPTTLAGAQILFNGVPAPLIYVSDKQSAAIAPFEVGNQANVGVAVVYGGVTSAAFTLPVTNTMPGLFAADRSGSGLGAIQNADGSYNSATNAAPAGSTVVLWVSGLGQMNPAQANGSVVAGANLPALRYSVTVTIGGQPATVVYQGPAPLAVAGLYQVNCVVPVAVAPGQARVVVTSDGRQSQQNLTVAVR